METLPPLLAAAVLVEQWTLLAPIQRRDWAGRLLAGAYLRRRKRVQHLPPWHFGRKLFRQETRPGRRADSLTDILTQVTYACNAGLDVHHRTMQAANLLRRKTDGRRAHSNLKGLATLLVDQPIVTTEMIRRKLSVSDVTAKSLIANLHPAIREITGRKRYCAWSATL